MSSLGTTFEVGSKHDFPSLTEAKKQEEAKISKKLVRRTMYSGKGDHPKKLRAECLRVTKLNDELTDLAIKAVPAALKVVKQFSDALGKDVNKDKKEVAAWREEAADAQHSLTMLLSLIEANAGAKIPQEEDSVLLHEEKLREMMKRGEVDSPHYSALLNWVKQTRINQDHLSQTEIPQASESDVARFLVRLDDAKLQRDLTVTPGSIQNEIDAMGTQVQERIKGNLLTDEKFKTQHDRFVSLLTRTALHKRMNDVVSTIKSYVEELKPDLVVLLKESNDFKVEVEQLTAKAINTRLSRSTLKELFTLYEKLRGVNPMSAKSGDQQFLDKVNKFIDHLRAKEEIDLRDDKEYERILKGEPLLKEVKFSLAERAVGLRVKIQDQIKVFEELLISFDPQKQLEEIFAEFQCFDSKEEEKLRSDMFKKLRGNHVWIENSLHELKFLWEDLFVKHDDTIPKKMGILFSTILTKFGNPVSIAYGLGRKTEYVKSAFQD